MSFSFNPPVPTVYLVLRINGWDLNPASSINTFIADETLSGIMCLARGPAELTSQVTLTLNWVVNQTSTTTLSDFVSNLYPQTTTGNITITNTTVTVINKQDASVRFAPKFVTELEGLYQCRGTSPSEGEVSSVVNLVLGKWVRYAGSGDMSMFSQKINDVRLAPCKLTTCII